MERSKRSRVRAGRTTVMAGVLLALVGTGPEAHAAEAAACAKPSEKEALDARVLQTELIVAALSCGENQRYKAFVGRFEKELVRRAGVMKTYFARSHGGRANKELNAFITSLANQASQRSLAEAAAFCANAARLFEAVLKVEPKDLVQFASARATAASHGVPACGELQTASRAEPRFRTLPPHALPWLKEGDAAPRAKVAGAGSADPTRTAANTPPPAGKDSGS